MGSWVHKHLFCATFCCYILVLGQHIDIPIYWSSCLLDTYIDTLPCVSIYRDIMIIETRMCSSPITLLQIPKNRSLPHVAQE